jgi:predicted helicase
MVCLHTMKQETYVSQYVEEITKQFNSGQAQEHAYRPALSALMNSFEDVVAVNDPKRSEHGNPDFVFLRDSNQKVIRGYAEAKDVISNLDKTEKSEQMQRYHGYANLFLTNYLEFRFFKNGEKYKTISLGHVSSGELKLTPETSGELARELQAFLELPPERIRSGKRLAGIMGGKARRIRDNVAIYLLHTDETKNRELEKIYRMMRELLVHDLTPDKFADMYAQTLVYGLFVACYGAGNSGEFNRRIARDLVPASNPFLRHFFDHIVGPDFDMRLAYIVDELCEVFSVSNLEEIVNKHLRIADSTTDAKDPIIHFYEDFLNEYDPIERKRMGAYYTPVPVVRFIVAQVDKMLKLEFGVAQGLASSETFTKQVDLGQKVMIRKGGALRSTRTSFLDKKFHRVQVLDPAVGTATFLNETIKFIHEGFMGQEGMWPSYVRDSLVKRLYGFELMMAPYTIAHLKLGMTLKETGAGKLTERLGVYLTNTLEESVPAQTDLFSFGLAEAVSDESRHAAEIKTERPIMVVMGNPPYSVSSNNKSSFIEKLVADYKKNLDEKNIQPLSDDYIKFIRFSEAMIAKNGQGIVAMITNNSFIDGLIHRQMRKHLMQTFDSIYILDLHGNSKKKETAPDGSKDENVFDIQQGVSIICAVKNSIGTDADTNADVYHAELYGSRKSKFKALTSPIEWAKLTPDSKMAYFVPKDNLAREVYDKFVSIRELMPLSNSGVQTKRDALFVDMDPDVLSLRVEKLLSGDVSSSFVKEYKVANSSSYKLADKLQQGKDFNEDFIRRYNYRPFDDRYIYYDRDLIGRAFYSAMKHMLAPNLGLIVTRQQSTGSFNHAFITDIVTDNNSISLQTKEISYLFPLYLHHDDGTSTTNLDPKTLRQFSANLGGEQLPEDILSYIYALLHSPSYRAAYGEFLKDDFPRVPPPSGDDEFSRMVHIGRELESLHMLRSETVHKFDTTYSVSGSDEVEKIEYVDSNVFINSEQYFGNVPEAAWDFYIGGYQPAQKWLKDRKGRKLTSQDVTHYQQVIKSLLETTRLMAEIDRSTLISPVAP